jgi:hypothetical protein
VILHPSRRHGVQGIPSFFHRRRTRIPTPETEAQSLVMQPQDFCVRGANQLSLSSTSTSAQINDTSNAELLLSQQSRRSWVVNLQNKTHERGRYLRHSSFCDIPQRSRCLAQSARGSALEENQGTRPGFNFCTFKARRSRPSRRPPVRAHVACRLGIPILVQ